MVVAVVMGLLLPIVIVVVVLLFFVRVAIGVVAAVAFTVLLL